jgi:hypothetical protein
MMRLVEIMYDETGRSLMRGADYAEAGRSMMRMVELCEAG